MSRSSPNSFGPRKTSSAPPRVPLPGANAFTAVDRESRPYRDPRKRVVVIVLLLVVAGYLSASLYMGLARTVYLVNGMDKSYVVNVAGRDYTLPPLSHTKIKVSEGSIPITVADPSFGIGPQTLNVSTPFWKRPFLNCTFVVNPDRAALIYKEVSVYSRSAGDAGQEAPDIHIGDLLTRFEGLDYEFEDFPHSIKVESKSTSDVRKSRVNVYDKGNAWERLQTIAGVGDEDAIKAYVRAYAPIHPEDARFLFLMTTMLSPEEGLAYYRPRLTARPVAIDVHRAYQHLMDVSQPGYDLTAEYRGHLAADPKSGPLKYLLGRVVQDRNEATRLFTEASRATPPVANAFNALAYEAMAAGEFESALELAQKAIAVSKADEFRVIWDQAQLALKHHDALLADVTRRRATNRRDQSLALEEIKLQAVSGQPEIARLSATTYALGMPRGANGASPPGADEFKVMADATIAYTAGDFTALAQAIIKLPAGEGAGLRFESYVSNGRLKEAAEVLGTIKRPTPVQHLSLYVAAAMAGDQKRAEAQLTAAAAAFGKGDRDDRRLATWLRATTPPASAEVCQVVTTVENKRAFLTAMGMKFRQDRVTYFEAAEKLNFDRAFPYWTLRKMMTGKSPRDE